MMPAWYQRMNPRERKLALFVATAFFLLINLVIWSKLSAMVTSTREQLAERKLARAEQRTLMKERDL